MVDGKRTLLLASDNNFGALQFTQFVALQLSSPIPEPASLTLLLGGLALLATGRAAAPTATSPAASSSTLASSGTTVVNAS